jgi:hypothetical protein
MDVESLLRDALDLRRVDDEPGIGFEQRVIGSLRERRSRRIRFVPAFVGLAAVLALTAVVLPWYLGSGSHPGSVASASASALPSPSETRTPFLATTSPTVNPTAIPTTHVNSWGLEFDYPTAWLISNAPPVRLPSGVPSTATRYLVARQAFGYVGTRTPETVCTDPTPLAGGGERPGICSSSWSLALDDVVVRFQQGDIAAQNILSGNPGGGVTVTTVGGLPAWFMRNAGSGIPELPAPNGNGLMTESVTTDSGAVADDATVLVWELPGNGTPAAAFNVTTPFRIVAAIRGPNSAAGEAEVQALVASIKYDPAVVPLPADPSARSALGQTALTSAIDLLGASLPAGSDCFPRQAGSKTATIKVAPNGPKLSKPLPVVCAVAIEPNAMEMWTVTITVTWTAAADRSAGMWTWTGFVNNKGQGGFGGDKTTNDQFPYEVPSGTPG